MSGHRTTVAIMMAAMLFGMGASLHAASNPATAWEPATVEDVRTKLSAWLDEAKVAPETRAKVLKPWSTADTNNLLDRLAESFAQVDPRVQSLVQVCSKPHTPGVLTKQDWLADPNAPTFLTRNMRLYYGRWMVQWSMVTSAYPLLAELEPTDVVEPATLLFYQAVIQHRLLQREEGLRAIRRLLAAEEQCPRRYVAVAKLMEQDLKGLKEDTLDHIARRMDDSRRRLDLGQGGPEVRGVQDGVIKSLDKLIKQIEDQQQKLEQQGAMGPGGNQSNSPAPESRILDGKGPGNVVKRDIGQKSGWGNISPKQREEAIQQIGRDFPPHYRELIEQYFRQLANEGTE